MTLAVASPSLTVPSAGALLFVLLMLAAQCTPPPATQDAPTPVDTTTVEDTAAVVRAVPPPPLCSSLDMLLMRATESARGGEYPLAHRLACTVIELLESRAPGEGIGPLQAEEYYGRTAQVYAELMPPSYADSALEPIAMMVFQNQIFRAFDPQSESPSDSAIADMVACQRSTTYSLPMVLNQRVRSSLAFFAGIRKGQLERWLSRSRLYLPAITHILADSGLPADLAYLPLIESGYNPRAYSYAHASGVWQFIPSTAKVYGMRRSYWLDERRDPIRSTTAAASYLGKLHREFGHWYLALASYNCGENGMRRAIDKAESRDFWDLTLPQQTMDYVPKFIAALVVARNPACFGLSLPGDSVVPPDTVYVSECLDLGRIAEGVGVPVDSLEELNPHILRWCTPPDFEDVILYLPPGTAETFRTFAKTLTPADKVKWKKYRIRPGDNLIAIARKFNTSVPAIRSVNKLRSSRIVAGRELFIPVSAGTDWSPPPAMSRSDPGSEETPPGAIRYLVKHGETISEVATLFNTSVKQICAWNGLQNANAIAAGSVVLIYLKPGAARKRSSAPVKTEAPTGVKKAYQVRRGDNLSAIAARLGVNLGDLRAWNDMNGSALIRPGDRLTYYVPKKRARSRPVSRTSQDTLSYQVQPGDNLSSIADLFSTTSAVLIRVNRLPANGLIHVGDIIKVPMGGKAPSRQDNSRRLIYYEVRRGDNLWNISQLFGVPLSELRSSNKLGQNSHIIPGDTLTIHLPEGR